MPPASGEITASLSPEKGFLDVVGEQRRAGQCDGAAAERVLECNRVVNFERDYAVGTDALEHAGDVPGCHRVIWLGAAVFACVAKVRRHRGDTRGSGVLNCANEEQ